MTKWRGPPPGPGLLRVSIYLRHWGCNMGHWPGCRKNESEISRAFDWPYNHGGRR